MTLDEFMKKYQNVQRAYEKKRRLPSFFMNKSRRLQIMELQLRVDNCKSQVENSNKELKKYLETLIRHIDLEENLFKSDLKKICEEMLKDLEGDNVSMPHIGGPQKNCLLFSNSTNVSKTGNKPKSAKDVIVEHFMSTTPSHSPEPTSSSEQNENTDLDGVYLNEVDVDNNSIIEKIKEHSGITKDMKDSRQVKSFLEFVVNETLKFLETETYNDKTKPEEYPESIARLVKNCFSSVKNVEDLSDAAIYSKAVSAIDNFKYVDGAMKFLDKAPSFHPNHQALNGPSKSNHEIFKKAGEHLGLINKEQAIHITDDKEPKIDLNHTEHTEKLLTALLVKDYDDQLTEEKAIKVAGKMIKENKGKDVSEVMKNAKKYIDEVNPIPEPIVQI